MRTLSKSVMLLALVAAAGSARAQCTWYIHDVPDFDQRRITQSGIQGLPGNGSMYCVPTSFTNWFAYFANRGSPQPATLDGPRDWQDNANYDRLTTVLLQMGVFMFTDAQEGTNGGAIGGAKTYASAAANGDFVISGDYFWGGGDPPTPQRLADLFACGAYTAGCYGHYHTTTGGDRDGGHAITFTGVFDLGCGTAPVLEFRDPADDPGNTTQSQFRTSLAAMTPIPGNYQPIVNASSVFAVLYRLDTDGPTTHFLDTLYVILPTAGLLTGGNDDAGEMQYVRPFRPQGNPAPATLLFNKPAGTGVVLDAIVTPDPLTQYYSTAQGASQGAGVWRLNLLTGQSTRINGGSVTGFAPDRLAYGRLGDLYVIDGASVRRYDPRTVPMTALGSFTPTFPPDAIAYDDKNDTLVILTEPPAVGSRRVMVRPRTLTGLGSDRPLPAAYSGEAFIQPDADTAGAYFVCSQGSGILRRFETQGTDLVETDSILHLNAGITGLNVTDANRLIYAVDGVLTERERNASGTWVVRPNSRWAGRAAGGSVSLARSRSNFLASVMEQPSFNNLANPTVYPSIPTCYANCDQSTLAPVLNVNDFSCFLNRYASGNVYANCDFSTNPPILNVNDFTCFMNRYAAGCP